MTLTDTVATKMDGKDIDGAAVEREAAAQELRRSLLGQRVLRKIDMRIIPLLFITYNFNFMDKTILSSASVFGLSDSTVGKSAACKLSRSPRVRT